MNFVAEQEFSMEHCCEMKCEIFSFNLCMLLYGFDSDGTSDGKQLIIISSVAVESEFVAPPACELCAF